MVADLPSKLIMPLFLIFRMGFKTLFGGEECEKGKLQLCDKKNKTSYWANSVQSSFPSTHPSPPFCCLTSCCRCLANSGIVVPVSLEYLPHYEGKMRGKSGNSAVQRQLGINEPTLWDTLASVSGMFHHFPASPPGSATSVWAQLVRLFASLISANLKVATHAISPSMSKHVQAMLD